MIDPAIIDEVLALVEAEGPEVEVVEKLRARWTDIHFTHCLEDELCLETTHPRREAGKPQ